MDKNSGYWLARIYSYVLHPFVLPLLVVSLLFFGNTILALIPLKFKYYFLMVIGVNTLVLPFVFIFIFRKLHLIGSFSPQLPNERLLPMIIVVAGYLVCAYFLSEYAVFQLITRVLLGVGVAVLVAIIVNFYWKISLYMIAIGGATGLFLGAYWQGAVPSLLYFFLFLGLSGFMASARLFLQRHSPAQVYSGFGVGFLILLLAIILR